MRTTLDDTLSETKQVVVKQAIESALLNEEHALASFLHIEGIKESVAALQAAFPSHFFHTFAAKANSMLKVLSLFKEFGMGVEVASPGELVQAQNAGFSPAQIAYDEPTKTHRGIKAVLEKGIAFNIDNFQEMDIVAALLAEMDSSSTIGVRINPQVGSGSIEAMSTATQTSKFGIALQDSGNRERLIRAFQKYPWLSCLHCHVGSQGCSPELMCTGIAATVNLAEDINQMLGRKQVDIIDIGGGLTVNFNNDEVKPSFDCYAQKLKQKVPQVFSGEYQIITEFGRSLLTKHGFTISRVEYTKTSGGRHIALTHLGAQIAVRTIFMPEMWKLRVSTTDANGKPKQGERIAQDIAGPCCFAGDIVAHQRPLPLLEPGDYVILHDTGAYYASNPFYYNALPAAAVYSYQKAEDGTVSFDTFRHPQSIEQALATIG